MSECLTQTEQNFKQQQQFLSFPPVSPAVMEQIFLEENSNEERIF